MQGAYQDAYQVMTHDLPQRTMCRAKGIARSWLIECQVSNPEKCRFVTSSGGRHFCQHPESKDIALETEVKQRGL